jgi:hypothetical protein
MPDAVRQEQAVSDYRFSGWPSEPRQEAAMTCYHGTTARRARRICQVGFLPRKPSRRVWFATSHGYALGRARCQARRSKDHPAVLTCDVNIAQLRTQFGKNKVFHRNGIIAISAPLPVSVLRSCPAGPDQPVSPDDLAAWVNDVLCLQPHRGVSRRHPGILRFSAWIVHRLSNRPNSHITTREMLAKCRQWLPDYFADLEIDPTDLRRQPRRRFSVAEIQVGGTELPKVDACINEALATLDAGSVKQRVKALAKLAELGKEDLFDWCVLLLDDEARGVRLAALATLLHCPSGDAEMLIDLADDPDKMIRAAAIAALAHHDVPNRSTWLRQGLTDPAPCVRLATAAQLEDVDPAIPAFHAIFELALYDPNPQVRRRAGRLTRGKGYAVQAW